MCCGCLSCFTAGLTTTYQCHAEHVRAQFCVLCRGPISHTPDLATLPDQMDAKGWRGGGLRWSGSTIVLVHNLFSSKHLDCLHLCLSTLCNIALTSPNGHSRGNYMKWQQSRSRRVARAPGVAPFGDVSAMLHANSLWLFVTIKAATLELIRQLLPNPLFCLHLPSSTRVGPTHRNLTSTPPNCPSTSVNSSPCRLDLAGFR